MTLQKNVDGNLIVGRINKSAYIVPIEGMYKLQGFTESQIKEIERVNKKFDDEIF